MYYCPSSKPLLPVTSSSLCCMVRCGWWLGCGECGDHGQWAGHRALGLATPVLTSTIRANPEQHPHCALLSDNNILNGKTTAVPMWCISLMYEMFIDWPLSGLCLSGLPWQCDLCLVRGRVTCSVGRVGTPSSLFPRFDNFPLPPESGLNHVEMIAALFSGVILT